MTKIVIVKYFYRLMVCRKTNNSVRRISIMGKKLLVIFCIWFIIISTVFEIIGINNFINQPTTQNCIFMMLEAVVICLCATVIYVVTERK